MEKKNYSKSSISLIKFFCILGIIVETLAILRLLLRSNFTLGFSQIESFFSFCYSDFYIFLIDAVSLLFFIILIFFPEKYEWGALISLIYSIKIITVDTVTNNPLGFILYLIGASCLLYRHYYKKHTILKIIFIIGLYFILDLHSLRFGLHHFLESLIVTFGYGLAILTILFFVINFFRSLHVQRTARIWDLSQYPELTQRDKEWLKMIIEEKKYEEIAAISGITVGTLKNRMHQIFTIVGVDDRIGLLATYSGYEIKF